SNPNGCLQGNFCAGQTVCGAPPPASLGCATIEAANGQCFCHQIQLCAGLQACTNSSTCPAGWVCAHSCCDFAFLCATHCLPPCGTHPQSPEANPELAAAAVGRTSGSATPIA